MLLMNSSSIFLSICFGLRVSFYFSSRVFLFVLCREFLVETLIHILEEIVSYLDDFSFWVEERMCSDPY
jgi:hypothetical protein